MPNWKQIRHASRQVEAGPGVRLDPLAVWFPELPMATAIAGAIYDDLWTIVQDYAPEGWRGAKVMVADTGQGFMAHGLHQLGADVQAVQHDHASLELMSLLRIRTLRRLPEQSAMRDVGVCLNVHPYWVLQSQDVEGERIENVVNRGMEWFASNCVRTYFQTCGAQARDTVTVPWLTNMDEEGAYLQDFFRRVELVTHTDGYGDDRWIWRCFS